MTAATISDPVQTVLAEAERWINERERPRNSNRGVAIDFFLYHAIGDRDRPHAWKPYKLGIIGAPWCAAFVSTVGRLAIGKAWPLEQTVRCTALGKEAVKKGILHERPEVGDLVLLYYANLGRYGHVGFVKEVNDDTITTIEGNTCPDGSREGHGVFERPRAVTDSTKFVRWVDLL